MNKNYDVDYFIKKFEAIPEDNWIQGNFVYKKKACAAGHCGVREDNNSVKGYSSTLEATSLVRLFSMIQITNQMVSYDDPLFSTISVINDGYALEYKQKTPKQRILAALYDIKKMQEPKPSYPDASKEILEKYPIREEKEIDVPVKRDIKV